jgi:hypothetical protein
MVWHKRPGKTIRARFGYQFRKAIYEIFSIIIGSIYLFTLNAPDDYVM